MGDEMGLGVVGCGSFGLYALQHFTQVPGVRLVGMANTHREAAIAAAKRFGIPDIEEIERMVERSDVDLIYISTPPFLHHPQAMTALRAGKHVICEKPLALNLEQADEMIQEARNQNVALATNLMQRYNPMFDKVKKMIEEQLLGEFLYAHFVNCANDEGLAPQHWFWDREKSGGIFIEHGVHFFDLFEGWFGEGKVVSAQRSIRPETTFEEQVNCTVRYGETGLVNFYHGFHQPSRMDRQEMRLVFERGQLSLEEWVPTQATVFAIADEEQTRDLCALFPDGRLDITVTYSPKDRSCVGRHKSCDVLQMLEMRVGEGKKKMHLYGELLRSMMADQTAWIRDRTHVRRIDEGNGWRSLAMAVEASRLATGALKKDEGMEE